MYIGDGWCGGRRRDQPGGHGLDLCAQDCVYDVRSSVDDIHHLVYDIQCSVDDMHHPILALILST